MGKKQKDKKEGRLSTDKQKKQGTLEKIKEDYKKYNNQLQKTKKTTKLQKSNRK